MVFSEEFKTNLSTLAMLWWISSVMQYCESDAADKIRIRIRARFEDSERFYRTDWVHIVSMLEAYPDIRIVVMDELNRLGYKSTEEKL